MFMEDLQLVYVFWIVCMQFLDFLYDLYPLELSCDVWSLEKMVADHNLEAKKVAFGITLVTKSATSIDNSINPNKSMLCWDTGSPLAINIFSLSIAQN